MATRLGCWEPKEAPRWPHLWPSSFKLVELGAQDGQNWLHVALGSPKLAPRWTKLGPRRLKVGPRWPQVSLSWLQVGPKIAWRPTFLNHTKNPQNPRENNAFHVSHTQAGLKSGPSPIQSDQYPIQSGSNLIKSDLYLIQIRSNPLKMVELGAQGGQAWLHVVLGSPKLAPTWTR